MPLEKRGLGKLGNNTAKGKARWIDGAMHALRGGGAKENFCILTPRRWAWLKKPYGIPRWVGKGGRQPTNMHVHGGLEGVGKNAHRWIDR